MPARLVALPLLLVLGCAHSPAPPPGPRTLAGRAQIQRAEATVDLTLRYELREGRTLEISAELHGGGSGSVGAVAVELRPDGFELAGPASWTAEVAAGETASNTWPLRPAQEGIARVEVRHGLAGGELDGSTTAAFRVSADAIRLCATADCAAEAP
ncbi:hypothetical protein [Nannocystis pusilla]|uniref:Lipoprotein n=1 Tax=Nannocystis pusilla TaxID=889268 RepID=A0ABS7U5X4_9BACT|nr:hypothetical protein [Nannocystis pusilla]MBZ5715978.1 hypothetical protein [Nannocystis pusilla]